MKIDVLIFAAKPGDAEIAMGGTIAKLVFEGVPVGIFDLLGCGLNSEKTKEELQFEISEANKILGVRNRENIGLLAEELNLDGGLIKRIVKIIRKHKPDLIFAPFKDEKDEFASILGKVVSAASGFAANADYITMFEDNLQDPHVAKKIFYYFLEADSEASFIIDVSKTFDIKMDAVKAYVSKFPEIKKEKSAAKPNAKDYFEYLEAKGKVFGYKIKKKFGEPFYAEEKLEFDIINFLQSNKGIGWR